jgi:hypothetical protein
MSSFCQPEAQVSVELPKMSPSRLRLYKKVDPVRIGKLLQFASSSSGKKKSTSRKPKAALLGRLTHKPEGPPRGHDKVQLHKAPHWDSLPPCRSDNTPHSSLPPEFLDKLKSCQETPVIDSSSPSCPLLAFFGLQWITVLRCLYCTDHTCFLAGDHIWAHLAFRHSGSFPGIRRAEVLKAFLAHVKDCLPLVETQSADDLKATFPRELLQPLDNIPVREQVECPVQGCSTWTTLKTGRARGGGDGAYKSHLKSHLKSRSLSGDGYERACQTKPQLTQSVRVPSSKTNVQWHIVFILPPSSEPKSRKFPSRINGPVISASSGEKWLKLLGWDEELLRISKALRMPKSGAIKMLQELVAPPRKDTILSRDSPTAKAVEYGLYRSNRLNIQYFTDMIDWISPKQTSFRLLFSHDK